jgi:hypothetical protein
MLPQDIDMVRHVCQHHLDTQYEESRDIFRVFFDMEDEEIEALGLLLNWVSDHGLEYYYRKEVA